MSKRTLVLLVTVFVLTFTVSCTLRASSHHHWGPDRHHIIYPESHGHHDITVHVQPTVHVRPGHDNHHPRRVRRSHTEHPRHRATRTHRKTRRAHKDRS